MISSDRNVNLQKIKIEPHLGDLKWVKGTFPSPYGVDKIEHHKLDDGTVKTTVDAPKEVKLLTK